MFNLINHPTLEILALVGSQVRDQFYMGNWASTVLNSVISKELMHLSVEASKTTATFPFPCF